MILQANALKIPLEDKSVQMICTSPPYWGLRDYGTATWKGGDDGCEHTTARSRGDDINPGDKQGSSAGSRPNTQWTCNCGAKRIDNQLGLEPTPEAYLENMVQVFREIWRVMRDDGCLFLNMGDSYWHTESSDRASRNDLTDHDVGAWGKRATTGVSRIGKIASGLKPKDLCMMPARLAMALQADGWYLRSMMPWVKRSAMPESCTDRPASALEYVFLLTKSSKYFFDMDAIRKETSSNTHNQISRNEIDRISSARNSGANTSIGKGGTPKSIKPDGKIKQNDSFSNAVCLPTNGRNFRNTDLFYQSLEEPHGMIFSGDEMVGLDVNPHGYKESHFATFPPKLIVPLIKAGTSERGCCVVCSAPWKRVVERTSMEIDRSNNHPPELRTRTSGKMTKAPTSKTIGWKRTCKHQAETNPCVVFDPFGGSGTVKDVAERLGRKAIVMDLSYEYCQQAKKRCVSDQMSLI